MGGGEVCSEYLGLILDQQFEAQASAAIFDQLYDGTHPRWNVLDLADIPSQSSQLEHLTSYFRRRGVTWNLEASRPNHLVRLPESWSQYLAGLSSKRRTKVRSIVKQYDSIGGAEYATIAGGESFDRLWSDFQALHNLRWTQAGKQSRFESSRFRDFHSEVAEEFHRRGDLVLGAIRIRGEAVAAVYGFRHGTVVYEYQRGHNPLWLPMRPGHALQFHMFREAMEAGVRTWDYLRGDYEHKRDWANDQRGIVQLRAAGPHATSRHRFRLQNGYRNIRSRIRQALPVRTARQR